MTSPSDSGATEPTRPIPEAPIRARASDVDREAVVRTQHDAVTRGLLTLEEGDERVAAAYAARFRDELPPLTADLPPAPAPAPVAPGWRALAVLAWLQLRAALAGLSWRGTGRAIRSRPRLAVASVALLALLSFGAVMVGEAFEHDGEIENGRQFEDGPQFENGQQMGPR